MLGLRQSDGATVRDHEESARRQWEKLGRAVKPRVLRDDEPAFPLELQHIWQWFDELSHARSSNGFALMPIGWAEIHAWAVLTGAEPEPWEVRVLVRLDAVYRSVVAEAAAKRDRQQPKPKSAR